jgi:ribosome-associated protein
MDIRKLQRAIVDGLEDVKAQNIAVFNTEHLSPLFERVIIASGTSNRQTKALASSVRDAVKSRGMQVLRTEGEENGEWIIVDCGAAVAHIMQPAIRDYYHLEEIWGGKAVHMKMGAAAQARPSMSAVAPEAAAEMEAPPPRKTARKTSRDAPGTPAKKAAKSSAAHKATARNPAAPRPPARGTAAKTVPRAAASAASGGARKTASKSRSGAGAARKAAADQAPARRVAPAKTAPRKTVARKTSARKTPSRGSARRG